MLVAWAKHSDLAKTKEDGLSVWRVGFKGIHWAWMGISALLYCEQRGGKSLFDANVADRGEPLCRLFTLPASWPASHGGTSPSTQPGALS